MTDLILDAGITVAACERNSPDDSIAALLDKADREGWRIWLYTAQLAEVLQRLASITDSNVGFQHIDLNIAQFDARQQLSKFASKHHWLSALGEDSEGLNFDDPIGHGLTRAAGRLGKDVKVVTDIPSRLDSGNPFVDVCTAMKQKSSHHVDFVDLKGQQDRIRSRIEHNVHKVMSHGKYIMGPEIRELETQLAEFVGVEHCICLSSGTDSLLVAMMALDLNEGDEVITTPFTFAATGEVIKMLGAKAVYVDIDSTTYNINIDSIEDAVTNRTKAIMPVSLYGQCADIDQINAIADRHSLSVIEDAAQSFGASLRGRKSCGLSTIGCTSFFPTKPLGGYGDGGACFTSDKQLADLIRLLINHGQDKKYNHKKLGINGRMDTLQAAVILAKLHNFEAEIVRRNEVANNYSNMLFKAEEKGFLRLPKIMEHNESVWAQYTIRVDNRHKIQEILNNSGIPTAIHYPSPLYRQPALLQEGVVCVNTEKVVTEVLSLPMHPYLNIETQDWISKTLIQALES